LIDKPEGIGLEDCSIVSKGISPILDENEESLGLVDNYSLEVSSPGVNRPLVKLIDFDRFKENDVKVILKSPDKSIDENRIRFKGYLKGIEEDKVILIVDEKELLIDYNSIKKANLVYKF
jgi:ribosome maturation factor RimP